MLKALWNLFGGRGGETAGERAPAGDDAYNFIVEWPTALPDRTGELEGARLFLTDVEILKGADIQQLSDAAERGAWGPLVLIAPGFDEDARRHISSEGWFAVRACPLGVERLDELLQDVAMRTGGRVFSTALGAGMPGVSQRSSGAGLVIPGTEWSDVTRDDLGYADGVSVGESSLTIRARPRDAGDIERWTRSLATQFKLAISDADRESIARRFARFGRSVEESPAFRPDDKFAADAVALTSGYSSPYFVTDAERCVADLRDARLLLVEAELTEIDHVIGPLESALENSLMPAVVIATKIAGGALATLVVNKLRGVLPVLGVDVGGGAEARESFGKLAAATGSSRIIHLDTLVSITPDDWGRASRVMAGRSWTIVSP